MERATVVGAHGFVGRALTALLRSEGCEVFEVGRGEPIPTLPSHLFYCAGTTADFRTRTFDTIDAHVTLLNYVLTAVSFESLTYLSTTRVYLGAASGDEDTDLVVNPTDPQYIYNLSKLTGECLCLADQRQSVRVARLSNVYGPKDPSDNFISSLVATARRGETLAIRSGRQAAKDYVWLGDAVAAIARMPLKGQSRLFNIASGRQTSNEVVATTIADALGVAVNFHDAVDPPAFPALNVRRMVDELSVTPCDFSAGSRLMFGTPM